MRISDSIISKVMKTIDLNVMGVRELEMRDAVYTDDGVTMPVISPWLTALVAYIKYSMDTGGQYVTYHAQ